MHSIGGCLFFKAISAMLQWIRKLSTPFHDLNYPETFCFTFTLCIALLLPLLSIQESKDDVFVFQLSFLERRKFFMVPDYSGSQQPIESLFHISSLLYQPIFTSRFFNIPLTKLKISVFSHLKSSIQSKTSISKSL